MDFRRSVAVLGLWVYGGVTVFGLRAFFFFLGGGGGGGWGLSFLSSGFVKYPPNPRCHVFSKPVVSPKPRTNGPVRSRTPRLRVSGLGFRV